jgi:hypothetical protein
MSYGESKEEWSDYDTNWLGLQVMPEMQKFVQTRKMYENSRITNHNKACELILCQYHN